MPTTSKPAVKIIDADWRSQSMSSLPVSRFGSSSGVGTLLPQPAGNGQPAAKPVKLEVVSEIPDAVALRKRAALSGWGEPPNLSSTLDASRIQASIRAAERGDTYMLFTIFRDMIVGYTHLQNEFAKRKLTVIGQPHTVLPARKGNKDDEKAVRVIGEMIAHTDNWQDALDNLLDATLWPVAVGEKLFAPVSPMDAKDYEFPVRYRLRKIDPVSPTLLCYKISYLAPSNDALQPMPVALPLGPEAASWNPDDWEPELRFYNVFHNGYPIYSPSDTYAPEKARHIVHRGTNLSKTIRDNFGGHLRAITGWWFLAMQGRDWFGRYMQRWGHPFVVGKVDAQQRDTVAFMQQALSIAMEIGGLVIDKNAEAQLMQAASLNGAEGYRLFLEVCNDEVSKVVVGQTLSSSARATGLGSGVAHLHGEVRQDYRQSDMRKLSDTLVKQLFHHYLRINGYAGRIKGIIWGGKDETQVSALAKSTKDFSDAGLQPTESGIETISERTGIQFERKPEPVEAADGTQTKPKKKKTKRSVSESDHEDLKDEVRKLRAHVADLGALIPGKTQAPANEPAITLDTAVKPYRFTPA